MLAIDKKKCQACEQSERKMGSFFIEIHMLIIFVTVVTTQKFQVRSRFSMLRKLNALFRSFSTLSYSFIFLERFSIIKSMKMIVFSHKITFL